MLLITWNGDEAVAFNLAECTVWCFFFVQVFRHVRKIATTDC